MRVLSIYVMTHIYQFSRISQMIDQSTKIIIFIVIPFKTPVLKWILGGPRLWLMFLYWELLDYMWSDTRGRKWKVFWWDTKDVVISIAPSTPWKSISMHWWLFSGTHSTLMFIRSIGLNLNAFYLICYWILWLRMQHFWKYLYWPSWD